MKTSIATVTVAGTLEEKLAAIAAAGFDGVEIFEQDFVAHDGGPREVGRMVRDHGLDITLFQPFRDFECLPEPLRSKAFDRARHKFDTMADLGTDRMLICSSCHPRALGGIDRAADDLAELGDIARERGLRLGYEALAWGRHVNDHRDAWEIVRRADHPSVGLVLDSFHSLGRKLDPDSIRSIPGDRIFFVQLADAPAIEMDLLYWSRHFRNMPGEGDLGVERFMRAVMATGYTGPISLEIFNDHFRGSDPQSVARDGYRSLVALMDDVRRAEPGVSQELPEIPARVAAEGIGFIEIATRGDEADDLAASLRSLGFDLAGRHRSKEIDLWRQGEIRIVVNREAEGHAAHTWNARGTCVCDIGIEVASGEDALSRARALGADPFHQEIGVGVLSLPAIRGLAGSVLHFVDGTNGLDRVWTDEFIPAPPEGPDAGLTHVDHLDQTMGYEDMLSWTLFYTSLFDMQKSPILDVIDPNGLIRAQDVTSRRGGFRVTLNATETHRTLAGGFLADSFGASVHQIAMSTDDIFATARALAARGFDPLPIPENYYDDLEARFDLPPGLLDRLREADILYDQIGGSEFFQLYSRVLPGGLYVEIVQRAPGYHRYGEANAPFRIAAQKRLARPKGMPRI